MYIYENLCLQQTWLFHYLIADNDSVSFRFIPVLCRGATSPSSCVKRHTFQFMEQVLHVWPLHRLSGQDQQVGEAIRLGLADVDPGTRSEARKAYWAFGDQFQLEAATLLSSMEARVASPERGRMSRQSSVARSQESVCPEEGGAGLTRRGSVRVRRSEEPGSSTLKRCPSVLDTLTDDLFQVQQCCGLHRGKESPGPAAILREQQGSGSRAAEARIAEEGGGEQR